MSCLDLNNAMKWFTSQDFVA